MHKKKVAVLFGGRSVEHEISVLSALQAIASLDVTKYEIFPVYIAQTGRWYCDPVLGKREFYKGGAEGIAKSLASVQEVTLLPHPGKRALVKVGAQSLMQKLFSSAPQEIPIDVFVPVFHGQYGEDGCIQGLLEMADVPYAGPNVLASAVAMNKYICKMLLTQHGVPVLPSVIVRKNEALTDLIAACSKITSSPGLSSYPIFVKPVNLGSSIGVGKATDQASLAASLMNVFQVDNEAIVEPCVTQLMEINVSVIENKTSADVSVVEIPVSSSGILSYEDKYLREGKGKKGPKNPSASEGMASLTRVINPSDLDPKYREQVQKFAALSYRILNLSGVVRFDFMVDLASGTLYFNELNPIPGSLSFYLWEKSTPQLLFSDILDRLIEGAERRSVEKQQLKREYGFKALR